MDSSVVERSAKIDKSIFQNSRSISGSGSSDERTYGIRVTNCHELDHGHWEVKTKSGSNVVDASEPASESDGSFNVTIVKPPANIVLEPENINVDIILFLLYCVSVCPPPQEFVANENGSITPIEITCIAEQCGPEPRFIWKIGKENTFTTQ